MNFALKKIAMKPKPNDSLYFHVLNVYKPQGLTSHDVVNRMRRLFDLRKVGHLGTLDPAAEGVLPICLGNATRLIEYFADNKRYTAEMTLGITTTTLDREGDIVSQTPLASDLSAAKLAAVLPQILSPFVGTIQQQVPLHSAVHVKGKKLYEYAHKGQTDVELPTKTVTIDRIDVMAINTDTPGHPVLVLDVHCGTGTYIRALARDIGQALGCGAYLSFLTRTGNGLFNLDNAVPLETLLESPDPTQYLMAPADWLGMPVVSIGDQQRIDDLCHGMKIEPEADMPYIKSNSLVLITHQGQAVAMTELERKRLKPIKVFQPVPVEPVSAHSTVDEPALAAPW